MQIIRGGESIELTVPELKSAAKEWEHLCLMQRIVSYLARYYNLPLSVNVATEAQQARMQAFYELYHIPFEAIVSSAYNCDIERLTTCSDQVYIFLSALAQSYEDIKDESQLPEEDAFLMLLQDKEGQAPSREIPTCCIQLGVFSQTSEKMLIGDPFAHRANPGLVTLQQPAYGLWSTAVQLVVPPNQHGESMVALLFAKSPGCPYSFQQLREQMFFWKKAPSIAVGSGVAGIFDDAYFQDPTLFGIPPVLGADKRWANACVELTNSYPYAGVLPHGAASCSGEGEGQYDVYFLRNSAGRIVAVAVDYLLYGEC